MSSAELWTRADRKARDLLVGATTKAICATLFREDGPCHYPKCLCLRIPLEVADVVDKMLKEPT